MGMNVNLTPQLEALVRAKVDSGQYASASEVVREALRLLQEQDELREARIAQLRSEITAGLQSPPGEDWDLATFRAEAHARHAARNPRR